MSTKYTKALRALVKGSKSKPTLIRAKKLLTPYISGTSLDELISDAETFRSTKARIEAVRISKQANNARNIKSKRM